MRKYKTAALAMAMVISCTMLFTACGDSASDSGSKSIPAQSSPTSNVTVESDEPEHRDTNTTFLEPEHPGTTVLENDFVTIDISNVSEGYFMVQYKGEKDKSAIKVTVPDGETEYQYIIKDKNYQTFPLSSGDGTYVIRVYEHKSDNNYTQIYADEVEVKLADEFRPYLYPNQYAWYTDGTEAVLLGIEFSDESETDLDYIGKVYNYVIDNVVYDDELAASSPKGYISDVDKTLETKKGICLDYAALMTAMLRSQSIPTKLVYGYSGTAYHAWISVYLEEIGWVDNIIEFNGESWSLMDPTLAANKKNSDKAVKEYVGDGSNYTIKFLY